MSTSLLCTFVVAVIGLASLIVAVGCCLGECAFRFEEWLNRRWSKK